MKRSSKLEITEEKDRMAEIGRQLRCPSGEAAAEVGDHMFLSNENMIFRTIDQLKLNHGQVTLEMGFGTGKHLPYLFGKTTDLQYWGEISKAMVSLAKVNNSVFVSEGKALFQLVEVNEKLPYADNHSDTFFSQHLIFLAGYPFSAKKKSIEY